MKLEWSMIKYANCRSFQYSMKRVRQVLEASGCTIHVPEYQDVRTGKMKPGMILYAVREVRPDEDPKELKVRITDQIRRVITRKAALRFRTIK